MPRPYCPTPDRCHAPRRGKCRCQPTSEKAGFASRERMKRLNADPEFKAAHAERMKRRHAERRGGYPPMPQHLRSYADKLRSAGIRGIHLHRAIAAAISERADA